MVMIIRCENNGQNQTIWQKCSRITKASVIVIEKAASYFSRVMSSITSIVPKHWIVLSVISVLNFMWAGIGVIAALIYACGILLSLYYFTRTKLYMEILLALESGISNRYIRDYLGLIVISLLIVFAMHVIIWAHIILSLALTIVVYTILFGILFYFLYEIANKILGKE